MNSFLIRTAKPSDAADLLEIYRPYVLETAITFEYEVPTVEEFTERIRQTLKRFPYLVLEDAAGHPMGYAYASRFQSRPAYDWAVELSIYLRRDCRGHGYGFKLYEALERLLRKQNIRNTYACIAWAETENIRLDNSSARFHERCGYSLAGTFHSCGYKFGHWYDMIWMEKHIGPHGTSVQSVIPFPDLQLSDVLSEIKTAVQSHTSSKCI